MGDKGETLASLGLGLIGAVVVAVIAHGHMAITADSVTYVAAAESVRAGAGLGTWLESPLVVFPPGWPLLIWLGMVIGLSSESAALAWIMVSLIAIPPFTLGIMRRCTTSVVARWAAVVALSLSPLVISWSFGALSEVPFVALVLATALMAIKSTEDGDRYLWIAALLSSVAPLIRYAGVGVPLGLAMWVLLSTARRRRFWRAIAAGVVGLVPFAILVARNISVASEPFGVREPSRLTIPGVLVQCLEGLGRCVLWGLDVAPGPIEAMAGMALLIVTVLSLTAVGVSCPESSAVWSDSTDDVPRQSRSSSWKHCDPSEFRARLLLAGLGSAQLVVMVVSRSRVEIDDLAPRLLAPAVVTLVMLTFALGADVAHRWLNTRMMLRSAAIVWCLVGLVATARFATRDQVLGYDQTEYVAIRAAEVLGELPPSCSTANGSETVSDCLVIANEPWLWFRSPFRPQISPRSFDAVRSGDIDALTKAASHKKVFLLWSTVSRPKDYLLSPELMSSSLKLAKLGRVDGLTVYEVSPN